LFWSDEMADHVRRLAFLWRYASPWRWEILFALFSLTIVSVSTLVFPLLIKLMVDEFQAPSGGMTGLPVLALILILLFVTSALVGYYGQFKMHSLGYRLRNTLRMDLYRNLLYRPMQFHKDQQVGELSARATEDIGKIQPVFTSLVAPVYQNMLIIAGGLIVSLILNWIATLVLLFFLVVPMPFVLRYSQRIRALGAQSQSEHARANASLEEALVAIREVKAFVREEKEIARYDRLLNDALKSELSASRLVIRGNQSAYFVLSAMLVAIFYLSATSALPGWTLGNMVATYFYAYTMAMAFLSTGRVYLTYQTVSGALERVVELLSSPSPRFSESKEIRVDGQRRSDIEFQDVSFGYAPGKQVLRNVEFRIQEGTWVVIGGPSGGGKSTIASLMMGFYEPWSGRVLVGNRSTAAWDQNELRRMIGYVGQDPMLFHGSVRENLLLSGKQVTDSDLSTIMQVSCLNEMLGDLPNGLDTVVGERGYTLSGGQKARVAIARALLVDPEILILDEANAMLEGDLEARLWQNLFTYRPTRTTVIFTHHTQNIPSVYTLYRADHGMVVAVDIETASAYKRRIA
jgi:ABC-type multidrug transport system fused ATPase/permease subunit